MVGVLVIACNISVCLSEVPPEQNDVFSSEISENNRDTHKYELDRAHEYHIPVITASAQVEVKCSSFLHKRKNVSKLCRFVHAYSASN